LKIVDRGSEVNFETQFTTTAGTVLQTTGATLTIQYPLDGFPLINGTHSTSFAMTNASTVTGTWEYNWDSTPSAEGTVNWQIIPDSTPKVGKTGNFRVRSRGAATWVHGPSTVTANDE
jgi:hypothetical protein